MSRKFISLVTGVALGFSSITASTAQADGSRYYVPVQQRNHTGEAVAATIAGLTTLFIIGKAIEQNNRNRAHTGGGHKPQAHAPQRHKPQVHHGQRGHAPKAHRGHGHGGQRQAHGNGHGGHAHWHRHPGGVKHVHRHGPRHHRHGH